MTEANIGDPEMYSMPDYVRGIKDFTRLPREAGKGRGLSIVLFPTKRMLIGILIKLTPNKKEVPLGT
jgi:hypothetical protein